MTDPTHFERAARVAVVIPLHCEVCRGTCRCSLGLVPAIRVQIAEQIENAIRAAVSASKGRRVYTVVCWACETVVKGVLVDAMTGEEQPLSDFCVCPRCGEEFAKHPRPEGAKLWSKEASP